MFTSKTSPPAFRIPSHVLILSYLLALCFIVTHSPGSVWYITADRFALVPSSVLYAPWRLISYSFLHDSWEHLIFNLAWLVIFGSTVARHLGSARFFFFFIFCAISAGVVYTVFNFGNGFPAVGASGAVFGLFGAFMRFLFPSKGDGLATQPQSLKRALQNRQTCTIVAVVIGIDVLFAAVGGIFGNDIIAWEAHIGGFIAGFVCFGWFALPSHSTSGGPRNFDYGEWR